MFDSMEESGRIMPLAPSPPKSERTEGNNPSSTKIRSHNLNICLPKTPSMVDSAPTIEAALATDVPVTKQTVDPWNVSGEIGADGIAKAINYEKLVDEFGTKLINKEDLERFEKVTGHKPHRFMRRQIVFSHRDLNLILDRHEKGEPFYLYTGRGPSSDSVHIGHTIPFEFTKYVERFNL